MPPPKKRKGPLGHPIDVVIAADDPATTPAPAFALFPAGQPDSSVPFQLYAAAGATPATQPLGPHLLAAETPEMEYDSRNHVGVGGAGLDREPLGEGEGYSVQYMLGVHNPRTHTLTLHAAPVHTFSTTIKSLKSGPAVHAPSQVFAQRALLGTTFGTKKAMRNLSAQARNRLDEQSFGAGTGIQHALQSAIAAASASLPTPAAVERNANLNRPIPPPNLDALRPDDVYDLDTVVSPAELAAVPLEPFRAAPTFSVRNRLLPYRRSEFIAQRLRALFPASASDSPSPSLSSKDTARLRLLIHLSHLLQFRTVAKPHHSDALDPAHLLTKLGNPDPVVVDALLDRYTELQRLGPGHERRRVTTAMEAKLLSYIAVVMLKLDRWNTDVETVAKDLGMSVKKTGELFKSLGCSLVTPTADERAVLVQQGRATTVAEAKKLLKAALRVPLTFPAERRGAPKR